MQRGHVIAGRFEIEALAGTGGMADVYRALDHTTATRVALKLLHANAPDDLARLAREAQALARLTHPSVVRYVAHGMAEDSAAYVAMEWIEGELLSARLRSGTLSLLETLQLGRALASALGSAHEHGIVHRDVKPGNIILRGHDLADPVLLDFGIAKTGLAVGLTQLGMLVGTPRYMAPEQARGTQQIDARADVFALGALMYRCFVGRAPFDGEDAVAILAHLFFDDVPDLCALASNVPRSVGSLFSTMLAKAAYDMARSLGVTLKLVTIELSAIQNLAFGCLCAGDTEGAIRGSREVLARATHEAPRLISLAQMCLARALAERGDLDAAESEARAAVVAARNEVMGMYARAVLADVLFAKNHLAEAVRFSSEAIAVLDTLRAFAVGDVYALIVHAEVLEASGARDGANEAIERARTMFESRRAYVTGVAARAAFDAWSPDAKRFRAVHQRLTTR